MNIDNMLPLAEYAEKVGKSKSTVSDKCKRGTLPGAVKIGRDWFIPADAEYPDYRVKDGKYVGIRRRREVEHND